MDIMEKQKYIFGSVFLLANKLQVLGDQHLGKDDMTTKQWFLTAMVSQFHDMAPTLSEVAELMGSSRQNVKQLALKLEEKGFLKIDKDEKDARALRLKLTEKSQAFWDNRQDRDEQFIKTLFEGMEDEELRAIEEGFNKLFARIGEMEGALALLEKKLDHK